MHKSPKVALLPGLVFVILLPVMIRPSGSGSFFGKLALEAFEARKVAEAAEVNDAGEVSKA